MSIKLNQNLTLLNQIYFKNNHKLKNILDSKFSINMSKDIIIERTNCLIIEFEDTYFLLKNRYINYELYNIGFKEIRLEDIQVEYEWLLKNIFNQNILIKIDLMTILTLK